MVVWLSNYCHPTVKLKQKTHRRSWQWVDKFRERIKTRPPRWSAARSQAAGLSFDSRGQFNVAMGKSQILNAK
jgi:hypothetical protein